MAVMSHVVSGIAMSDRSRVWPEIVTFMDFNNGFSVVTSCGIRSASVLL